MVKKEDVQYVNSDDPTLLLIKGSFDDKLESKRYIKTLAQALYTVAEKHGVAKMRCVGAAALNNAIKAEIIAAGEFNKNGSSLIVIPSFQTVTFESNERTAIVLTVELEQQ